MHRPWTAADRRAVASRTSLSPTQEVRLARRRKSLAFISLLLLEKDENVTTKGNGQPDVGRAWARQGRMNEAIGCLPRTGTDEIRKDSSELSNASLQENGNNAVRSSF